MGELFSKICQEFNKKTIIKIGDFEDRARQAVELEEQGAIDVEENLSFSMILLKQRTKIRRFWSINL